MTPTDIQLVFIKHSSWLSFHFLFVYLPMRRIMHKFFLRKLNAFLMPHSQIFLQSIPSNYQYKRNSFPSPVQTVLSALANSL